MRDGRIPYILIEIIKFRFEDVGQFMDSIREWRHLSDKERDKRWSRLKKEHPEPSEYAAELLSDEYYIADRSERLMYGVLAVALTSAIEYSTLEICKATRVQIQKQKNDRTPKWKVIWDSIKKQSNILFDSIKGHKAVNKIRILNNCFKHNGGATNTELACEFPGEYEIGTDILYEKENWECLLKDCRTFILELASRMFCLED